MPEEQNAHRSASPGSPSGDRSSSQGSGGGYNRGGGDRSQGGGGGYNRGGDRSQGGGGGYNRGGDRSSQGGGRRYGGRRFQRKKVCRFTKEGVVYIDYKNYRLLRDFLTERGKIMPRRITGISAKHQRMLTQAIKRARHMALLPFVSSQ